jgi:hypothetical protein
MSMSNIAIVVCPASALFLETSCGTCSRLDLDYDVARKREDGGAARLRSYR